MPMFQSPGLVRVGGAWVGGDRSGNARGDSAVDIQSLRSAPDRVASGYQSAAFGLNCRSDGSFSVAVGVNCQTPGGSSVAIGTSCQASGYAGIAIGLSCQASGQYSAAIGRGAYTDTPDSINFGGLPILRKASSHTSYMVAQGSGVEAVLITPPVNFVLTSNNNLFLPSGSRFFVDEIGIIVSSGSAVSQPTVRAGNTSDRSALLTAVVTTGLTAIGSRQRFTSALTPDGQTTLTADVTVAATDGDVFGRFYFKGLFVAY
jgi:hypothetical protein